MERADYDGMNFRPDDLLNDLNLRQCSMAAIGLWWYCMCLMHRGKPYGHLTTEAGTPLEPELWKYVPAHPNDIPTLMAELESNKVFSRTDCLMKIPYSRRMVKDHATRVKRRKGGKLGGNPSLLFDAWYTKYPVKKGKAAALRAFDKALKKVNIDVLHAGVDRLNQAITDGAQDEKFIKHPATWLNQGCWDDEYKGRGGRRKLKDGEQF